MYIGFLWIAKGIHEFVLGISLKNLCNILIKCGFSSGAPWSQGGNKCSVVKSLMVSLGFKWVKEFLGPSSYFSSSYLSSHVYYTLSYTCTALLCHLQRHHKLCNYVEPKPFSWAKPAHDDFSSSNFTLQDYHMLSTAGDALVPFLFYHHKTL